MHLAGSPGWSSIPCLGQVALVQPSPRKPSRSRHISSLGSSSQSLQARYDELQEWTGRRGWNQEEYNSRLEAGHLDGTYYSYAQLLGVGTAFDSTCSRYLKCCFACNLSAISCTGVGSTVAAALRLHVISLSRERSMSCCFWLQELLTLVPHLAKPAQKFPPSLLLALLDSPEGVAHNLICLKQLFPSADVFRIILSR